MLVIKDEAKITVDYPIEKFANKEKILYFDIETTGLSRKYCSIYLIGAMYFEDGEWDSIILTYEIEDDFDNENEVIQMRLKVNRGKPREINQTTGKQYVYVFAVEFQDVEYDTTNCN